MSVAEPANEMPQKMAHNLIDRALMAGGLQRLHGDGAGPRALLRARRGPRAPEVMPNLKMLVKGHFNMLVKGHVKMLVNA